MFLSDLYKLPLIFYVIYFLNDVVVIFTTALIVFYALEIKGEKQKTKFIVFIALICFELIYTVFIVNHLL